MQINAARYEGGTLILETADPEARKIPYNFKPGEYQIIKAKKKRSVDANNFLWSLAAEIGAAVNLPKEDIYRRCIREAGVHTPLPIKAEAVEDFTRIWSTKGIGWFCDLIDDSKIPGYKVIFAYHGSSEYDTAQMSRLIDNMIQDAHAVGIDTIGEREKSLLLEEWSK